MSPSLRFAQTINFYQQGFGSPMGFCTSPFFAEIALEKLENNCLEKLKNSVFYFSRYVGDVFAMIENNK